MEYSLNSLEPHTQYTFRKMLSYIIALDGYIQTVGPHKETVIIQLTDREIWKELQGQSKIVKELNYRPGSISRK